MADRRPFAGRLLFRTSESSVTRCGCCGEIEVRFRGLGLRLSDRDFHCLVRSVQRLEEARRSAPNASGWRLSCGFGEDEESWVEISAEEIAQLHKLLDGAAFVLELETMIGEMGITASAG